ncbi:phosphatidylglycerophosphatase A [Ideonella sp.]|uniref:phosphatidylglycerophosphatase A family protein n=1 Tax=Ideonella sp. TaxID=1929293 RepID=UPI003BB71590
MSPSSPPPIEDARVLSEPAGSAGPQAPRRPGAWLMRRSPLHWVSLGFGSGLSPVAPGTVGTLWAWVAFLVINPWLDALQWAGVLLAGLGLGWWACTRTAQALHTADPGAIVWDEVLAFWLILWIITPASLGLQLAAFVVFRIFDAAKPGPVRWADRLFKGQPGQAPGWAQGFGILFDDLVAALCTLVVLALWLS